uniref:Uncharacterized protein n=1 Tax=Glossina pallidipes TaxID=7398 RepID=A0A1A9ZF68_GLOPL
MDCFLITTFIGCPRAKDAIVKKIEAVSGTVSQRQIVIERAVAIVRRTVHGKRWVKRAPWNNQTEFVYCAKQRKIFYEVQILPTLKTVDDDGQTIVATLSKWSPSKMSKRKQFENTHGTS